MSRFIECVVGVAAILFSVYALFKSVAEGLGAMELALSQLGRSWPVGWVVIVANGVASLLLLGVGILALMGRGRWWLWLGVHQLIQGAYYVLSAALLERVGLTAPDERGLLAVAHVGLALQYIWWFFVWGPLLGFWACKRMRSSGVSD